METQFTRRVYYFAAVWLIVLLSPLHSALGDVAAGQEWVDIPVVVNIVNQSDADNVDEAIEKANEILAQAHIRLVVKRTNQNVEVGNNDGLLGQIEGEKAQRMGQEELAGVVGAGKGIKITFADDVWTEQPNSIGWAVHRNPVVFVETGGDANEMGITTAHEVVHALTVSGHSADPNDLMYETVGERLRQSDIDEIFPNAKRRGDSYIVAPRVLPVESVVVPAGIDYPAVVRGAILDECDDVDVHDPFGLGGGPSTLSTDYADLGEVAVYCDRPFGPNGSLSLEFQFCGPWLDNGFNNRLIAAEIGGKTIHVEIGGPTGNRATLYDPVADSFIDLPRPDIHQNQRFDGPITQWEVVNHSVAAEVPIELVALNLTSAKPIMAGTSTTYDFSGGLSRPPLEINDNFGPFPLALDVPCTCPGLKFARLGDKLGIFGCGFEGSVEIQLNGRKLGDAQAGPDGQFVLDEAELAEIDKLINEILAIEVDGSGPSGAGYARGFVDTRTDEMLDCPDGDPLDWDLDLDGDGDVDESDMYLFNRCVEHWILNWSLNR